VRQHLGAKRTTELPQARAVFPQEATEGAGPAIGQRLGNALRLRCVAL
jgi:hypothetical protein